MNAVFAGMDHLKHLMNQNFREYSGFIAHTHQKVYALNVGLICICYMAMILDVHCAEQQIHTMNQFDLLI